MGENQFNVERTKAGLQFIIPGTEKPTPVPKIKYATDGSQLVIPGAERISEKTLLTRILEKPRRPRVGQHGVAGTPLFGSSRPK